MFRYFFTFENNMYYLTAFITDIGMKESLANLMITAADEKPVVWAPPAPDPPNPNS